MDVYEICESVNSKEGFIQFVNALKRDFESNEAEWENHTIPMFLDSLSAFCEDSSEIPDLPTWKSLAILLYMGKIYE